MTRVAWLLLAVAACKNDRPAAVTAAGSGSAGSAGIAAVAPADAATPPAAGDRAYVTDETGLVEIGPQGTQVLAKDVSWCNADARAQVVWFVTDHGLQVFDLADRKIHDVIARDLQVRSKDGAITGSLEPIIHWGKEQLGGEDAVSFDVGIAVHMQAAPKLEMEMGCDGDRGVYCYDDNHKPVANVVALQKLAKKLSIADPTYAASLASRGATRSLWSPPPVPPKAPKPPELDRTKCTEMPDHCGELTAIPGSPLWLVHTADSRGDYYHESRELWDPDARAFVRFDGGKLVRAKDPQGEDGPEFDSLRSSPSGLMSIRGIVFDATHVIYAPHGSGNTCGFASGGWRVAGPRG